MPVFQYFLVYNPLYVNHATTDLVKIYVSKG